MAKMDEQAIWLEFARAAIQSYEPSEEVSTLNDLVDDVADVGALVADAMLEEFKERFADAPRRRSERSRRRRERGVEPEED